MNRMLVCIYRVVGRSSSSLADRASFLPHTEEGIDGVVVMFWFEGLEKSLILKSAIFSVEKCINCDGVNSIIKYLG